MGYSAAAWVLPAGNAGGAVHGSLIREQIVLEDLEPNEVLAAPIYGCWEANMSHALARSPIDVCRFRGEPKVVLGNSGVVSVVKTGHNVTELSVGQHAIVVPNGVEDQWGYTVKALGYDAAGRSGTLATLVKLTHRQLAPIPPRSRFPLLAWAAFSSRYVTAWSNWRLALGVFRLLVSNEQCPAPHVWGWGGGTTFAELDLARRHGCRTAMLSGNDENLELIARRGITPVDRRLFGELDWDEDRYAKDSNYRREYRQREKLFLREVRRLTDAEMVQIFLDYIGGPVYRATLMALSREGVIATAGWKKGMKISYLRAEECIARHQHIHSHYARHSDAIEAIAYAEKTGWMPDVPDRVYSFDDIPQLVEDYINSKTGYFPCFSINPE